MPFGNDPWSRQAPEPDPGTIGSVLAGPRVTAYIQLHEGKKNQTPSAAFSVSSEVFLASHSNISSSMAKVECKIPFL